jgi:pimeloyl-ACP methyl ester carboxylesterase
VSAQKRRNVVISGIFGTAVLGLAWVVALNYRRDIRAARERVSFGSQVVETPCGPIEYAIQGEGPPVLVVHGASGGFDQGLEIIARDYVGEGFRFIAPSRFGYLRTPLPANATPVAQADAYACLLDTLNIPRVAVVGSSAGAFSCVQFALRHPGRTSALVLAMPDVWAPASQAPTQDLMAKGLNYLAVGGFITDVVFRSDFIMWLVTKVARPAMVTFLGVPKELQLQLTPAQEESISELMQALLPVSQRQEGIINDAINHANRQRYPLERITAPTLVVDAADVSTYPGSKYTAENIPGARFLEFERGGHLLIGHEEEVRSQVTAFLKQHAAPQEGGKAISE